MLAGSVLLGTSALLLGWPLAFALACWLLCPEKSGGSALRTAVGGLVRIMTAVPTVVYGFAAVFLLAPVIRSGLGGSGMSWLTASLMLCLLILPTVVLILQAGLGARLDALVLPGRAMGFTRLELLWHFVLPGSAGPLASSAVLGFGRAVGDTMLPLMLAGNAPDVPSSLTAGTRSLTAHMALVTSNEVGGAAYDSLFMAGMLLLLINAAVSLCIRRLGGRQ
ncbi:MAG: ABC transporter permease subunit [Desulfovibrionaceae bacterium]|nr:ABC transporter permease subunit [Desulfovibrionaceae bacterium]